MVGVIISHYTPKVNTTTPALRQF